MCRFSHLDAAGRSKLGRYLTLTFMASIILHGIAATVTSIWTLANNVIPSCAFLDKYYAAFALLLISGVCDIVSVCAGWFYMRFYRGSFVRVFMFCLMVIGGMELCSIISAAVLARVKSRTLRDDMLNSFRTAHNTNASENEDNIFCWSNMQKRLSCCGALSRRDWCAVSRTDNATSLCDKRGLNSCSCLSKDDSKCELLGNQSVYRTSCIDAVDVRLGVALTVVGAVSGAFLLVQGVSYLALCILLPRVNSRAAVDTYKPRPVVFIAHAQNLAVSP